MIEATEAERLAYSRIKWEGKTKRVSGMRKGNLGKQKTSPSKKVLVQKKKEEIKKGGQQPSKAPFSFVICYNCGGRGHTMKSCTSASKAVSKKIERKAVQMDKGQKKVKIIHDKRSSI